MERMQNQNVSEISLLKKELQNKGQEKLSFNVMMKQLKNNTG
jgi:hypothetical protein